MPQRSIAQGIVYCRNSGQSKLALPGWWPPPWMTQRLTSVPA
jgi:hypothetical protein